MQTHMAFNKPEKNKRYKPLVVSDFRAYIEGEMGFIEVFPDKVWERVWERKINENISIRIYSTIPRNSNLSRALGEDAIRTHLFDYRTNKIIYSGESTYRTKKALENMRNKARKLWYHYKDFKCPICGGLLVARTNARKKQAFLGCTSYPICKHTK